MKSFKHWTRQEIADTFGLQVAPSCKDLEEWLAVDTQASDKEKNQLLRLQNKLKKHVDMWNEQELIIKFIALLIDMVDYDELTYKAFANRKLKGVIDGEEIAGEVDLMIASGEFEPKAPYFCLHEYKKEKGFDNDPLGQLIIAMLTAQASQSIAHNTKLPIYGAYVMGRNWFFLTLKDRKYCMSEEYVATRDDLFKIYNILKKLKQLIGERSS